MSCENCEKLKLELLSALAAIEKAKEMPGRNDFGDKDTLARIRECLNTIDLSLLHEHDAQLLKEHGL